MPLAGRLAHHAVGQVMTVSPASTARLARTAAASCRRPCPTSCPPGDAVHLGSDEPLHQVRLGYGAAGSSRTGMRIRPGVEGR